jgi:Spermine/spermidine synthase domain
VTLCPCSAPERPAHRGVSALSHLTHTAPPQELRCQPPCAPAAACPQPQSRRANPPRECRDHRLELIHDDAYARLRDYPGTFDVIIGDLNDPVDGGPCYKLYTDDFYRTVVANKLNAGGVFVTQSGPCGMLSAPQVFTSIHRTLAASFGAVVPYCCHVPSFVDEWVRARLPRPPACRACRA